MKIIVTGAYGFIGKNLCLMLEENGYKDIVRVGSSTCITALSLDLKNADFVFHLAGVNRPIEQNDFNLINVDLTQFIVDELKKNQKKTPIMFSSSIQAEYNNQYGKSKAIAEKIIEQYSDESGAPYYIYRFPNVFGKWSRPNYNSFIATFCHNIINDLNVDIHDPNVDISLVYIDDVCRELISLLNSHKNNGFQTISPVYNTTVGAVADLLYAFKNSRTNLVTESVGNGLIRALYSTYLSYLSPNQFSYSIPSYVDNRGAFCEMLKTKSAGQFSFFTAHPGVTRGGHYHHSKSEKFLVIKGKALFKFEHVITGERYHIETSGDCFQIIETIPGWSHDITNISDQELIVMLWANEIFDRNLPDTFARLL